MIITLIFLANFAFIVYIFVRYYRSDSIITAFSQVGLIIVMFSVLWAICTFVVNLVIPSEGFGKELNANTIALILVALLEIVLFRYLFGRSRSTEDETEI